MFQLYQYCIKNDLNCLSSVMDLIDELICHLEESNIESSELGEFLLSIIQKKTAKDTVVLPRLIVLY